MANESDKSYSFDLEAQLPPIAIALPVEQSAVVGSIVKLDGRASTDPQGQTLTYAWSFTQVPIGSQVAVSGFSNLDDDSSVVTFAPDITGTYKVQLIVNNGSLDSDPCEIVVDTRVILVPNNTGFIPDTSFVWNYLSDFWKLVDGRKKIETFWSSAVQIAASAQLKLYQYDYNKSIKDIQDLIQRRWIHYDSELVLDSEATSFILADDQAGQKAATYQVNSVTEQKNAVQPDYSTSVTIPLTEGAFDKTSYGQTVASGRVLKVGGRSFTMVRASRLTTLGLFFGDQASVPTQLSKQYWRFSATLISSEYNFETEGVSAGDVIDVEIARQDVPLTSVIQAQVVSVDRNRLGFVLNIDDLSDGVAAGWLSSSAQLQLASDFNIGPVLVAQDGSLVYMNDALAIKQVVSSIAFKRAWFETPLTPDTVINVGPFSITATPTKIHRCKAIPVDVDLKSVPVLQEYIKQPDLMTKDSQLYYVTEDGQFPAARDPYVLTENLDYIIDDESEITGTCSITAQSQVINIPLGDLLDRSVAEGDTIDVVTDGVRTLSFLVLRVLDSENLRVFPAAPETNSAGQFTLTRRVPGKFIRFINNTFSKSQPAPTRLWAEVSYFDNSQSVEDNFGVLVGVKREDLESVGSSIPYKSAVAGLMYALATGPKIDNFQLASQILLGLPFSRNAGTIVEINPDYRTNTDGSPLTGRIVVKAEDSSGKSLGLTDIYLYPQGKQYEDPLNPGKWLPVIPDLSGIAINDNTGVEFAVGDHVDQFTALSKGTQVIDYVNTPAWVQKFIDQGDVTVSLRKYHTFQLVINSDVVSFTDSALVADFLRRAKSTYTTLILSLFKTVEDSIDVEDSIIFNRTVDLSDAVSFGLIQGSTIDPQTVDGSFTTDEGSQWAFLLEGTDLQTTQGSLTVTSATGGFINSLPHLTHDQQYIRAGYLLQITSGDNQGSYLVSSVADDNTIVLSSTDQDGESVGFETISNQSFLVFRPIQPRLGDGTVAVTDGNPQITATFSGLQSMGITANDRVLLINDTNKTVSRLYRIVSVDTVGETFLVDSQPSESSGNYRAVFIREGLTTEWLLNTSAQASLNSNTVSGNWMTLYNTSDLEIFGALQLGDILTPTSGAEVGEQLVVLDVDPSTLSVYTSPAGTAQTSYIATRPSRSATVISTDILDRIPIDSLHLILTSVVGDLLTTSGSNQVSTSSAVDFGDLGVSPGDYLAITSGADSTIDVGYGMGLYPIAAVSTTTITLTRNLTETHGAGNTVGYGIERILPNERLPMNAIVQPARE